MAKCTGCEHYWKSKDCDGEEVTGCADGGDVSNPDEDINCPAGGDEEI